MNLKWIICMAVVTGLVGGTVHAQDNASVAGKVVYEGEAPKPKKIKMDADPQCAAMHADVAPTSEEVLVGADGALKNVFVYVKSGLTKTYEAPKTPVVIDQVGCIYKPRVFGIQTRQPLVIKNSDDTLHNIHAQTTVNEEFNKGQPAGAADIRRAFPKPEVMVKFKCDVHPWMTAYMGVVEHPFYGVTGDDGAFKLEGLPAGEYVIEAWHEKLGTQTQTVKLGDGESKTIEFKFAKKE